MGAEEIARRYQAALERHDLSALMALVTDDVTIEFPFHESGDNGPEVIRIFHGREAVQQLFERGLPLEERIKFLDETFTLSADGKTVFVECRGDMLMHNGRPYKNRYIFRVDVRDGKIVHVKEYLNPVTAAIAFGRPIAGNTVPPAR